MDSQSPTLIELMQSYKRIKVIEIACSFITNLDGVLLLVMLVGSELNCDGYVAWFQQIGVSVYLAFQIFSSLVLGIITDLTQDYSLPVMRACSIIYIISDAVLYFLPIDLQNVAIIQSPYFVLICFMLRQASILQVENCAGKILKMKLDKDKRNEESQIAIFNHIGIFCDACSRIILILTLLVLWVLIDALEMNIGFLWAKSILFISSFVIDIIAVAFSFSITEEYFTIPPEPVVAAVDNLNSSGNELYSSILKQSSEYETDSLLINSPIVQEEVDETPKSNSACHHFKDALVVIAMHEGGLLRDVNLHLIFISSLYGFVTIILQFDVQVPLHGTDFRNGFCGGQLMGIFILNIMTNTIFMFGSILYQAVFVKMRPYYFYSCIYMIMSVVLVGSLSAKYFNVPPYITALLYAITGLVGNWSISFDSFLAYAISPADYVGIVGVLPNIGSALMGMMIIGYSFLNLADWITITLIISIAVALMAFTVAICFFHNKALHALDNKELLEKEKSNLYTRFILGYY